MKEYVIPQDYNDFRGSVTTILYDGVCPYTHKTREQYLNAELSVVDEFWKLYHRYEDSICGHWKDISEEYYEEMFATLPPIDYYQGGFYFFERYMGNVTYFFQQIGSRYFTSKQRLDRPREEVLASLKAFIETTAASDRIIHEGNEALL